MPSKSKKTKKLSAGKGDSMSGTINQAKQSNLKEDIDASQSEEQHSTALTTSGGRSRLLSLPPELRNMIWEHVLIKDWIIRAVYPTERRETPKTRSFEPEPDLLLVSKQVRAEALPMYYGRNTFWIRSDKTLGATRSWIRLRPYCFRYLACVVLSYALAGPQNGIEFTRKQILSGDCRFSVKWFKKRLGKRSQGLADNIWFVRPCKESLEKAAKKARAVKDFNKMIGINPKPWSRV